MPISSDQLDSRQREAVEHVSGPMLVVAGAGTGKTTVLVERIIRLIRQGHAAPQEILAVTFTDNAAHELQSRVQRELRDVDISELKTSTFHAYCHQMLKQTGRGFEVISKEDLWVLLRRRISQLGLDRFIKAANPAEFLNDLLAFCDRCRDELVSPADYQRYVDGLALGGGELPRVSKTKESAALSREERLARCLEIARVYAKVQRWLAESRLGTFGDMIVGAVELLRADPAVLAWQQGGARFILIDEFQDSNRAQIELAALLAGKEQNVFAVGDPDQAIFRFRGASSGAFDEFLRRFRDVRRGVLARNHRSTTPILSCAFAVISKNPGIARADNAAGLAFQRSPLQSFREEQAAKSGHPLAAEPVSVVLASSNPSEAGEIAESIVQRHAERAGACRWSDFAVLYRSHSHREELAEEFSWRNIPFAVCGLDVLQTTPVRDLLSAMRAIWFSGDSVSLLRLAALPQFGISPEELRRALDHAPRDAEIAAVFSSVRGGVKLLRDLEHCRQFVNSGQPPISRAILFILSCFRFPLGDPAILAVQNFVEKWEANPTTQTGRLAEFLEYLDYYVEARGRICLPEPAGDEDAVRFLTAHAAKGLEFKHVYVVRANSGSFPANYHEPLFAFPQALRQAPAAADENDKELHDQEERRLFYVAMTRARDSLTLSAKPGNGQDATPSGFLRPLLKEAKLRPWLRARTARPYRIDVAAAAAAAVVPSAIAPWLLLPPQDSLPTAPLSATAIETYEKCPLQFKIQQDWNLPGEVVAAMHFGNSMHTVMKHYFDELGAGRSPAEPEILEYFRGVLARLPFDDPLQRQLYEKQGMAQLVSFMESRQRAPAPLVSATERAFQIEIGGVQVKGRMDRVDTLAETANTVVITDYKTGRPRNQKEADNSLQLSIYALAAQRAWGLEPRRLIFHNLETNALLETSRSPDELLQTEERVRQVAQDIAAQKFEPNVGHHCAWCPYNTICPATEQKLYSIAKSMQAVSSGVN